MNSDEDVGGDGAGRHDDQGIHIELEHRLFGDPLGDSQHRVDDGLAIAGWRAAIAVEEAGDVERGQGGGAAAKRYVATAKAVAAQDDGGEPA